MISNSFPAPFSAQWKNVKSPAPLPAGGAAGKKEGVRREEDKEREEEDDDVVPIVICSSEERMGATMAAVNSVHSNTDARLFFYIVTLRDAVKLTRYLTSHPQKTKLHQYGMVWLPIHLCPNLKVQHEMQYLEILKKKQWHQVDAF